ncbi:helix-turn-helix domain-containing protein [Chryseobacterium antibioticum]|uniref:Helix-turn-helix domain-containing protein n=1 Tax=Chryseobacterium pyrolae TaxID=2987481 RepID=A0ABT2IL04_9FLAO|nr:helix-turn-helix domain-containing protein [Chryseobacterium pyrolae]MCT2409333.1 helix-turn-helix domain-containing protein [Chryseobacterium pyrolae]
MEKSYPDYKRIYNDIITKRYPQKKKICRGILEKEELSALDVIKLNSLIFETKNKEATIFNQQHRSYDKSAILDILNYQKKNKLNNTQIALHFKLSRNSIAKWKKMAEFDKSL